MSTPSIVPTTEKAPENPTTENPASEKPATEKPSTEKPSTKKPSTEKPSTENPTTDKLPESEKATADPEKTPSTTEKAISDAEKTVKATEEPVSDAPIDTKASMEIPAPKDETKVTESDTPSSEKKATDTEGKLEAESEEEQHLKQEPKRRSAYQYFIAAQQMLTKTENPGLSHQEITKILSAKWKALTPEQKLPYEEQVNNDKKRAKDVNKTNESESARYSLRNSAIIKDGEGLAGKKRALETEEPEANKKKFVEE